MSNVFSAIDNHVTDLHKRIQQFGFYIEVREKFDNFEVIVHQEKQDKGMPLMVVFISEERYGTRLVRKWQPYVGLNLTIVHNSEDLQYHVLDLIMSEPLIKSAQEKSILEQAVQAQGSQVKKARQL